MRKNRKKKRDTEKKRKGILWEKMRESRKMGKKIYHRNKIEENK